MEAAVSDCDDFEETEDEGMAYLMNCGEIAPPSPTYYNGIKKSYEANGMDTSYLRAALERAVYHVQHQEQ